jgi:hypothetical protein
MCIQGGVRTRHLAAAQSNTAIAWGLLPNHGRALCECHQMCLVCLFLIGVNSAGSGSENHREVPQGDLESRRNPHLGKEQKSIGRSPDQKALRGQRFVGSDACVCSRRAETQLTSSNQ